MKKLSFSIYYIIIAGILVSACGKKGDQQAAVKKRYILTNEYNNANNSAIAKYFVDDVPTTIGNPSVSEIYGEDLEVSGNDVYVLASRRPISGGAFDAVVYKNGVELVTVSAVAGVYYNCLAVNGSDIYLAGMHYPSGGVPKIIQWKNGTVTSITENTGSNATDARPYDMTIAGSDVYIAGYETATGSPYNKLPRYWKNGVAVTPNASPGVYSIIHRIVVAGNDVYCAGQSDDKAVYWKNGVPVVLNSLSGWCYGIAVDGGNIYAAGSISASPGIYNAVSWKNTTQAMLSNITAAGVVSVYGIGLDGNDVYIIGSMPEANGSGAKSVYWKNGTLTILPTGDGYNGYAYRIVIK
ncbi:MAG: hypothetical protein ACK4S0_08000 [Sediminibacterium sp.]